MTVDFKKIFFLIIIFSLSFNSNLKAETLEIKEILEIIQKDLRTLERAVYSESFSKSSKSSSNQDISNQNAEDVLTQHLLKLSEIEKQFQDLTNKYEEINFKLDKLSSRLSKVQSDNQMRFQNLENNTTENNIENSSLSSLPKKEEEQKKILPGSSQPQDLGTLSYKDMTTKDETQIIQSVDSTKTVSTEIFVSFYYLHICFCLYYHPRTTGQQRFVVASVNYLTRTFNIYLMTVCIFTTLFDCYNRVVCTMFLVCTYHVLIHMYVFFLCSHKSFIFFKSLADSCGIST